MEIATQYASVISGSHLSRREALTSYIQYILPKHRYQPRLLSMTKQQCDKVMTVLLKALLPKLHVNRNTARSIIYGPESLGGLALPDIYTLQGSDYLQLFLGNLRIQDRTANLIHINLTYLQLLAGVGLFFLNPPFKNFLWIESGWISSLWEFISQVGIQLVYPLQWLPSLPRRQDAYLMQTFQSKNASDKDLATLNRCRIFLQVISISDISLADGSALLSEVKEGRRPEGRRSRLEWPVQGPPSAQDWKIWRSYLQHIENNSKLISPLGSGYKTHTRSGYISWIWTQILYIPFTTTSCIDLNPLFNLRLEHVPPIGHGTIMTRQLGLPFYH